MKLGLTGWKERGLRGGVVVSEGRSTRAGVLKGEGLKGGLKGVKSESKVDGKGGVSSRGGMGSQGGRGAAGGSRGGRGAVGLGAKGSGLKGKGGKGVRGGTGKGGAGKGVSGMGRGRGGGRKSRGLARKSHSLRGVALPPQELAWKSLTRLYGVGVSRSKRLCEELGIQRSVRSGERLVAQVDERAKVIGGSYRVGSDRRREEGRIRNRYRSLNKRKGQRRRLGLPVRGQHTSTNGKTARKLNPGRALRAISSG